MTALAFVPMFDPPRTAKQSARVGWIVADNGCHLWQGARDRKGYGYVYAPSGPRLVHRVRYEREVGPVPDGMVLDHFVCDTTQCCNPEHVRPVAQRENVLRGDGHTAWNAAKTHCVNGHPLSGDNLYVKQGKRTARRECRECDRARCRSYNKRRQARRRNAASQVAP